jgi:tetratricopeptide (TPR) repeat protein
MDVETPFGDVPVAPIVEKPPSPRRRPVAPPSRSEQAGGLFKLGPGAIDLDAILGDMMEERPAGAAQWAETEPDHQSEPTSSESVEVDLSGVLHEMKAPPAKPMRAKAKEGSMSDAKRGPGDPEGGFKDFRDEVSRETSADAAAQHYKLATTYKDMGMMDEAMNSLQVAVRAPQLRFEAASMLARICADRNMRPQAIEWLERAAEAPAPTVEAGRALLYELGELLEGEGETARALGVFLELQADAGEYRDLPKRIERLSKVQTRG